MKTSSRGMVHFVSIRKAVWLFLPLTFFLISTAWANPGILQLATRDGFFNNQFPDRLISLVHVYNYWADEFADGDGNTTDTDDTTVELGIVRLIKPWHFGDKKQYQYILEGIFSYENLTIEGNDFASSTNASGVFNPMIYTSLGWNNADQTTHLQAALIAVFPWGDDDLKAAGDNSYQLMPLLAFEQRFGDFWIDGSIGFYHYFDDRSSTDTTGKSYFEVNLIPSYHIGPWSVYLQGDYKVTRESQVDGVDQDDDGYNLAIAGGLSWMFRPDMQLNLKYVQDVDGENELQGQGINLRWMWIF